MGLLANRVGVPELLGVLGPSLPSNLETPETEPDDCFVDCPIRSITPEVSLSVSLDNPALRLTTGWASKGLATPDVACHEARFSVAATLDCSRSAGGKRPPGGDSADHRRVERASRCRLSEVKDPCGGTM
jgi:hypothetical protein